MATVAVVARSMLGAGGGKTPATITSSCSSLNSSSDDGITKCLNWSLSYITFTVSPEGTSMCRRRTQRFQWNIVDGQICGSRICVLAKFK
jgi:hypothetical protein